MQENLAPQIEERQQKEQKKNQTRLLVLMIYNLYLGLILAVSAQAYNDLILAGLYHKIITLGVNIPIGAILIAVFYGCMAFLVYVFVRVDYQVYKNGLQVIEVKERVKNTSPISLKKLVKLTSFGEMVICYVLVAGAILFGWQYITQTAILDDSTIGTGLLISSVLTMVAGAFMYKRPLLDLYVWYYIKTGRTIIKDIKPKASFFSVMGNQEVN